MKKPSRLLLSAFLTLAVLLAAASVAVAAAEPEPEPEPGPSECVNLPDCHPMTTAPWVEIPAAVPGVSESNEPILEAGTVMWRLECNGNEVPVGWDYNVPSGSPPFRVSALIPPFHIGMTGSRNANFLGVSDVGFKPVTFQPLIGCTPGTNFGSSSAATSSARPQGTTTRQRTFTHTLHPHKDVTFTHRCAKGEELVDSAHGVAFYRKTPPTEKEMRGVEVERTERGGRVVVHVHTGTFAGERVALQIHAFCRAG